MARLVPLAPGSTADSILVEGQAMPEPGERTLIVRENVVSPGYFRTMGIPLIRGRDFTDEEAWERGGAIIINKALAEQLFGDEEPLGRRVTTGFEWRTGYADEKTIPWFTIVGVTGNSVQRSLDQEIASEMFHPYINPYSDITSSSTTFVVRGPTRVLASIREAMAERDPNVAIGSVATVDEIAARSLAPRRLSLGLVTAFAAAATLMAAIGLYGTLAYAAAQRVREIGVRMSVGARRQDILMMFLGEAVVIAGAGVALGTIAAITLWNWMASMLFQVHPWDPGGYAAAILVVTAVALAASLIPAIRASRTDPVDSLR
jgi:hypothetical protein